MVNVELRGVGRVPNVGAPMEVTFPPAPTCNATLDDTIRTMTLTNLEDSALTVADLQLTDMNGAAITDGPFRLIDFQPGDVAADADLAVQIAFEPTEPGTVEGQVRVFLGGDSAPVVIIPLRGEGVSPEAWAELTGSLSPCQPTQSYYSCRAGGPGPSPVALALLALGLWLARRRSILRPARQSPPRSMRAIRGVLDSTADGTDGSDRGGTDDRVVDDSDKRVRAV
jgi:MYXO-CTERM domain-containing protein